MKDDDPVLAADKFVKNLNRLTEEEYIQREKASFEYQKNAFDNFSNCFKKNICSVCKGKLESFDLNKPCIHWLLLPKGFKKKHFLIITKKSGLINVHRYLRWVANQDGYAKNINDINQGNHLIKETIRWRNIEWSLSCSNSDLEGHGKRNGHYHMQIRKDGRLFVKFNESHIDLKYEDIALLEAIRHPDSGPWQGYPFGDGMRTVFSQDPNQIISNMVDADEPDNSMLSVDTLVIAKEGSYISGDELANIIEEAKKSNESIASASRKLNNVSIRSEINLGSGVVKETPRAGGRGSKKS